MKKLLLLSALFILLTNMAQASYTLTKFDVTISNGVITSCNLPSGIIAIIIPETIDGQTVTGIASGAGYYQGVFYGRGLMSVTLPATLETIGDFAFCVNNISLLDLSNCTSLKTIGNSAFYNNRLPSVNFSACTSLLSIGAWAFQYNSLSTVDFSNCTSLKTIATGAFDGSSYTGMGQNQISSLDFTGCTALTSIAGYAFQRNFLTEQNTLTPCTALNSIGEKAFYDNGFPFGLKLPIVLGFERYGWKDGLGSSFNGGDVIGQFETYYYAPNRHTLTDADVYINDGIITACFYNFKSKEIIIPNELKGETVTGIDDGIFKDKGITAVFFPPALKMIGNSAFANNSIENIDLKSSENLTFIGLGAFSGNNASNLILPIVPSLSSKKWEDTNGTEFNHGETVSDLTTSYRLPSPYTLTSSDVVVSDGVLSSCSYNFASKEIIIPPYLDGQYVKEIGFAVFNDKGLTSVELPRTIEKIGEYALSQNNLASIDFSSCNELRYIGQHALQSNGFSSFYLPLVNRIGSLGWYVGYRTLPQGTEVSVQDNINYNMYINVYVLTDNDVVVTNGVITSCSYTPGNRNILIPSKLDNQTVIGIADNDNGVFAYKYLYLVALPSTIQKIGKNAFEENLITSIDLSGCNKLTQIGERAFGYNKIASLNLDACSSLTHIEEDAFYDNVITTELDLTDCIALTHIGLDAFAYSSIPSVNFTKCTELTYIGDGAFEDNALNQLDLTKCNKLKYIGEYAFSDNTITSFKLPLITGYLNEKWRDNSGNTYSGDETVTDFETFYSFPIPYTLTNDDVVVENGIITSSSYSFESKDIIIPSTLDGQTVKGIADYERDEIFNRKNIFTIQLPSTVEYLGDNCFSDNKLSNVDFTNSTSLIYIGEYAFSSNDISSFKLPVYSANDTLKWVDKDGNEYACGDSVTNLYTYYRLPVPYTLTDEDVVVVNNEIVSCSYSFAAKDIIIPNSLDGQTIKGIAGNNDDGIFQGKEISSVELPTSIESIGKRAFKENNLSSINLNECTALLSIGEEAFYQNNIKDIDLSACQALTTIDYGAFYYNEITNLNINDCASLETIGGTAFYSNNLTELDFSGCTKLKLIGNSAFKYNYPTSLNLTNCTSLTSIGSSAFVNGKFTALDLTTCTALESIGDYAFQNCPISNPDLSKCTSLISIGRYAFYKTGGNTFNLPTPNISGKIFEYWEDSNNTQYAGGIQVTDMTLTYTAKLLEGNKLTFTITDGTKPIEGAVVSIEGQDDKISDTEGKAIFGILASDSVFYTVTATNYLSVSDSVWTNDSINNEEVSMEFCADSILLNEQICGVGGYTIGDSTYYKSGNYTTRLINRAGCDSIVTLNLTVNAIYTIDSVANICEGEQVVIGDSTYTETGIYITEMKSWFGCDSTITLNLTVHPVYDIDSVSTICEGEQVIIGDSSYTETGIYITEMKSRFACDSTITLKLTVNPVYDIDSVSTICEGEQVVIGDSSYTETGIYITEMKTQLGCDSTITLNLTVHPVYDIDSVSTICEGDQVVIGDSSYTETGIYITEMKTQLGCDSIITLNLTVHPVYDIDSVSTICEGDQVVIGDSSYTETGIYITEMKSRFGCDSTITLNLTVHPVYDIDSVSTICEGDQIVIGDSSYTQTGEYVTKMKSRFGCDSTVTLNLTVLSENTLLNETLCEGQIFTVGDSSFTESGNYTIPFKNQLGCDSIVTLNLSVSNSYCLTYVPDDNFEQALIDLGLDVLPLNDSVPTGNINSIDTLNLNSKSISDLTGIEAFEALEVFNCSNNKLTEIDLSNNTALIKLNCSQNQLTKLDLSGTPNINELDCNNNDLGTLAVSGLTDLINLLCYQNNNLTAINLSFNTKLVWLNCGFCDLDVLDVSKNTALVSLVCSGNNLTDLDISANGSIYHLLCGQNELTSLNIQNGNIASFSTLQASDNPNLTCILVDDETSANAKTGWYKDAAAEYHVDCRPQTYIPDDNFEAKLIAMGFDTVAWDNYVPTEAIDTITKLNLSGLSITDLTGIEDFVQLTELDISNNNLSAMDLSSNQHLTNLSCGQNSFQSIDVSSLVNLVLLYCNTNPIGSLDLSKNLALEELRCNSTNITNLDVSTCTKLKSLICNDMLGDFNTLNIKNTDLDYLRAYVNPDLYCIMVSHPNDAASKANTNTFEVDDQVHFSTTCATTYVPDPNFENALALQGLDEHGGIDGYVYTESIDTLVVLEVPAASIDSLTGIEDFSALKYLNCNDNLLTILDLSSNSALQYLGCEQNSIQILDLSTNNKLERLECERNQLETLTLGNNSQFSYLDCGFNQLNNLDISGVASLEYLECDENNIVSLDLSNHTKLEALDCDSNQIITLDLNSNLALEYLKCSNNQLTELRVKNGNNSLLALFDATKNPNLFCIEVDDTVAANNIYYSGNLKSTKPTNNTWYKDDIAEYSEECVYACEYTLSSNSTTVNANAGNYSVGVSASSPTCKWIAKEGSSWISLVQTDSITGNSLVEFRVTANPSARPRSAIISIAGINFTLNQEGAECTYMLSSTGEEFNHEEANGSFNVNTINDCVWNAQSNCDWVDITNSFGTGTSSVNFTVNSNTELLERTCQITLGEEMFTIVQSGYIAPLSNQAEIISFTIPEQVAATEISDSVIVITMPYNTDLTALVAEVEISTNASITPASETVTNFSEPVQFLVTAEDGVTTQNWTVFVENKPLINSSDSTIINELLSIFEELDIVQDSVDKYVTIIGDYVVELNLSGLNLEGNLPEIISGLDSLRHLDLSNNNLSGLLPDIFGIISEALKVALLENKLTLNYLNLSNNRFVFSDLEAVWENLIQIPEFIYSPQAMCGETLDTTIDKGLDFSMGIKAYVPGTYDQYQWYKDGNLIQEAINPTLILSSITYADSGIYTCIITNTLVTGLTLTTQNITLKVSTPVGIEDVLLPQLKLYPNPATHKVFVETGITRPALLHILDIGGRQIKQVKEFTDGEIDISGFTNGIYIIRISDQKHISTKRLIVR